MQVSYCVNAVYHHVGWALDCSTSMASQCVCIVAHSTVLWIHALNDGGTPCSKFQMDIGLWLTFASKLKSSVCVSTLNNHPFDSSISQLPRLNIKKNLDGVWTWEHEDQILTGWIRNLSRWAPRIRLHQTARIDGRYPGCGDQAKCNLILHNHVGDPMPGI
jgi:hypothetical protein